MTADDARIAKAINDNLRLCECGGRRRVIHVIRNGYEYLVACWYCKKTQTVTRELP